MAQRTSDSNKGRNRPKLMSWFHTAEKALFALLLVVSVLPGLPLLLLVMPVMDLLKIVGATIF
jgi:hypothetical protein